MKAINEGSASGSALDAITAQNKMKSPFLRLLAEIRNQIYGYILSNKGIRICHETGCGDGVLHSKDDTPSYSYENLASDDDRIYAWAHNMHGHFSRSLLRLVRVCKQIYVETRFLVLSSNVLKGKLDDIIMFLQDKILDPNQMSAVKFVQIEDGTKFCHYHGCVTSELHVDTKSMLERLEKLQGLEKVILHFLCFNPYHQAHANFGILSSREVEKAVCLNGKTVEVEFVLEKHSSNDYARFSLLSLRPLWDFYITQPYFSAIGLRRVSFVKSSGLP